MKKILSAMLLFSVTYASVEEVELKLNNPSIKKQTAKCSDGGVVKTEDITIYAKNFHYSKKDGHTVKASENLLIKFGRYFFVGDSIHYNFESKRGYIINGQGTTYNAIAGGKRIDLYEDGSLKITDAFVTPSPAIPPVFEFTSPEINISKSTKAVSKTVVGKLNGVPFLWLPSFGMTMDKKYKKPPSIYYALRAYPITSTKIDPVTNKKTKKSTSIPVFVGRYKIYDNDKLQTYTRLEYQAAQLNPNSGKYNPDGSNKPYPWYAGLGGAIDLDYKSEDQSFKLQTRNFYNYGLWPLNPDSNQLKNRYRIQGKFNGDVKEKNINMFVQWDVLSDRFMRSDFPVTLFDIGTLEKNEAYLKYMTDPAFVSIYARPRVNSYRGFKQELPTFNIAVSPLELYNTKIFFDQTYTASYLNYSYSRKVIQAFQADGTEVTDFRSGRFSSLVDMYRPIELGALVLTPRVGFDGIFYTRNQNRKESFQAVCNYGGDLKMELYGKYDTFSHYIKPYVEYNGLTQPTTTINQGLTTENLAEGKNIHYVFGIKDGYAAYNQLIFGLNNSIYYDRFDVDEPTFAFNVSAMKFFGTSSFQEPLSKGNIELLWNFPKIEIGAKFGWNFEKNVYDYLKIHYGQTINDYFAFSSMFRTRGEYWWRKNNHSNFIIDTYQTIDELQNTPLTNPRYCFVNKLQMQLTPLWTFQYENNIGQGDVGSNLVGLFTKNETFYWQNRFTLSMALSNLYRLKFQYHIANSKYKGFSFSFDLM